jgi:lysophospholipase L1-like esterase
MKQILIYGASITHGVGGENGGWAEKLKAAFHKQMFGADTEGEWYEVYELGIPGQTTSDVLGRFDTELKARLRVKRPKDLVVVLSIGLNDSKAVDVVDNHLRTPDDFAANIHSFIHLAKDFTPNILIVGLAPVDESKTRPKQNFAGKDVYLTNERIRIFDETLERTCDEEGTQFVPLFNEAPSDWVQHYLWADGVHPNDAGHEWIKGEVEPVLREMLGQAAA